MPTANNYPTETSDQDGFRLHRLEVLNWGTFDKQIWIIHPKGQTALLTGANGSGKSTLVDALVTLFVPSRGRKYNLASSERRSERDERTYIRGAYGRRSREDGLAGDEMLYLRTLDAHSILLGAFYHHNLKKYITVAQILWINNDGSAERRFVVAEQDLTIVQDFSGVNDLRELGRQLKTKRAEMFDQFNRYRERLKKLFNLRSEQAFNLFNQIVSIKDIDRLDTFIREHMLEQTSAEDRVKELQASYHDLTASYKALQMAQKQRDMLIPMLKRADEYDERQERIELTRRSALVAPFYFAHCKRELLTNALESEHQALEEHHAIEDSLEVKLAQLREKQGELKADIRSDTAGQRLQQIEQQLRDIHALENSKRKAAERYNRSAQALKRPPYSDEVSFVATHQWANETHKKSASIRKQLTNERDEQVQLQGDIIKVMRELEAEIKSLQQRRSRIADADDRIRRSLAQFLRIEMDGLPFTGELIQVRTIEQTWEPAIQRLLKSYGRRLLVSAPHYQAVSQYVNENDLRGRLVYIRVTAEDQRPQSRPEEPNALFHKLDINPDPQHLVFAKWLHNDLIANQHFICCDTLQDFQRQKYAITREGQIRRGTQHEKDDRRGLSDASEYVLGWDNRSKIEALFKHGQSKHTELEEVRGKIADLEQRMERFNERKSNLDTLMSIESFQEIDWQSEKVRQDDLAAEKQKLEAASDKLKVLQTQLNIVEKDIQEAAAALKVIQQALASHRINIQRYESDQSACERELSRAPDDAAEFKKPIEEELKNEVLSMETISRLEREVTARFNNRAQSLAGNQQRLGEQIIGDMGKFRQEFPAIAEEIDASLDAIPAYRSLLAHIEHDDLPRYTERFKRMLEVNLIRSLTLFRGQLEEQYKAIEDSIRQLNESLRQINYSDSTYIEINYKRSRNAEVNEFRKALNTALGDAANFSHEAAFERIRDIIDRFEQDARWTTLVTDVRNWMEFSATERFRETGEEKEKHSDSSGKSGGQKVKLAYTILASAVAYQYGLENPETRGKTLRLVVVDEAFSKSDERNSRFAMELFRMLGFQLVVVTPLDKFSVVEPYIGVVHFVTNNRQENFSQVMDLTIKEFQAKRAELSLDGLVQ